jgi:DNA-binding NtrC family response regulator
MGSCPVSPGAPAFALFLLRRRQALSKLHAKYARAGNARELENAAERAVVLLMGEYVSERALPPAFMDKGQDSHAPQAVSLHLSNIYSNQASGCVNNKHMFANCERRCLRPPEALPFTVGEWGGRKKLIMRIAEAS